MRGNRGIRTLAPWTVAPGHLPPESLGHLPPGQMCKCKCDKLQVSRGKFSGGKCLEGGVRGKMSVFGNGFVRNFQKNVYSSWIRRI